MNTSIERFTPLHGDLYLLHRRPGHPQVILNDGYRGLQRLDPWCGASLGLHPFPPRQRQQGGAVGPLFLREEGLRALATAWDDGDAALLDLDSGQARDLPFPIPGGQRSLRSLWDQRSLICADHKGEHFFSLLDGGDLQPISSLALRQQHPAWRRALHAHTFPHGRVLRVYNEEQAFLSLQRATPDATPSVTRADWRRETSWACTATHGVDDAAALPDDLFLLTQDTVWRHRPKHEPTPFLRPEPGWELRALELLPAHGARPAALVTLQRHRVQLLDLRLVLTPLDGRPDLSTTGPQPLHILGEGLAALTEALAEASRRSEPAALFLSNTAHPLFAADRDTLRAALRHAWPQEHSALLPLRLFNDLGAHDFDPDDLRAGP